ncbi:MAG: OmpA family protein [Cyclobacteriaceae bacterium]|nr:OmpA family protein [Cyclobacteriaceae bacterium]
MKKPLLTALSVILLFFYFEGNAQKRPKKLKNAGVVTLDDSLTTYSQSDIFDFPNVNSERFYTNSKALQEIQRYDNAGVDDKLYEALKNYVRNFGVENFGKNVPMLWKLAQLSETHGPPGEAILIYKLILKHHQQGINIEKLFHVYDSIETDKKEFYVPLDYYYDLVDLRKEIDTLRPPKSVLINMGDDINSLKEDYGPTIGNVDDILLFTSKRNLKYVAGERVVNEDLFFSLTMPGGYWGKAQEFTTINTSYNEGSACLSQDGKQLFFSRCNSPGSLGNCDLYVSTLGADSVWSASKNLGATINSTGWDSHPSLTHSGDTLYFASNRAGGFGLSDIYYSVKDEKGDWQKAKNAGPIINTRNSEVSPFFHRKFNVLYFSSNGHPLNFGEFDIYKSYFRNGSWVEPRNIGPLVNGGGSEYYFTIDSESKSLYYARSVEEDINNLDLYSFPVPMGAQPEANVALKGSLKSSQTGEPLKGIVSIIDLDEGVEVAPKYLRDDGTFNFELINKRNYLLIIQGDDFFRIEELFFLDGEMRIDREADPIESKIAFESLEFENGKADILESMHKDLDKVANFLIDHPNLGLRISGHTDSAGKEESNLKLSQDRADAIRRYLLDAFNIKDSRVEAIGYGSSKPIVQELTNKDRQLNRRVEFEIFKSD